MMPDELEKTDNSSFSLISASKLGLRDEKKKLIDDSEKFPFLNENPEHEAFIARLKKEEAKENEKDIIKMRLYDRFMAMDFSNSDFETLEKLLVPFDKKLLFQALKFFNKRHFSTNVQNMYKNKSRDSLPNTFLFHAERDYNTALWLLYYRYIEVKEISRATFYRILDTVEQKGFPTFRKDFMAYKAMKEEENKQEGYKQQYIIGKMELGTYFHLKALGKDYYNEKDYWAVMNNIRANIQEETNK